MLYASPPNSLSLANLPTPLQPLDRLSAQLGGPRIWIKRDDLTGTGLTGNKVRKLNFVVRKALDLGADTLITCGGVQSNHCRATALIAAQLGLSCHLVLRGNQQQANDGNALLGRLAGAEVDYISSHQYARELPQIFAGIEGDYRSRGRRPYSIPTGASDGIGLWGYYCAAKELFDDFANHLLDSPLVVCATGSGGTHAGLALGFAHLSSNIQVRAYAVCDNREYFERKAAADIRHWYQLYQPGADVNLPLLDVCDGYIGEGYGVANDAVYSAMGLLARTEGIILDPVYTGKAFSGLIDQLRSGTLPRTNDVVFVHTGGVYGVFPHRQQIERFL